MTTRRFCIAIVVALLAVVAVAQLDARSRRLDYGVHFEGGQAQEMATTYSADGKIVKEWTATVTNNSTVSCHAYMYGADDTVTIDVRIVDPNGSQIAQVDGYHYGALNLYPSAQFTTAGTYRCWAQFYVGIEPLGILEDTQYFGS